MARIFDAPSSTLVLGLFLFLGGRFLQANELPNGDFRKVDAAGRVISWTSATWPDGKALPDSTRREEGGVTYLEVPATAGFASGWSSLPLPASRMIHGLEVSGRIWVSEDYRENRPWIFLAWYDEGKFLGRTDLNQLVVMKPGQWQDVRQRVIDRIPGATRVALSIATTPLPNTAEATGRIRFADFKLRALAPGEEAPFSLKAAAYASWWFLGDTITYALASGAPPEDMEKLRGEVFDSLGRSRGVVETSPENLKINGWRWKPDVPGYYEVEFEMIDSTGRKTPIRSSFTPVAPNGTKKTFQRNRFQFAVAAGRASPDFQRGQFGFSYLLNPADIPLAQLIGFDFAFIHSVPWGAHFLNTSRAIEPEKGMYRWESLDRQVADLSSAGFQIAAQFLSIPNWASPHPEKSDVIAICVYESMTYAPKEMDDFSDFVRKTVLRYRDKIRIWEIWNEPNLPGQSCFWADTPENYVKLLEAGYRAVKEAQPDAQVWIGGLGPRRSYHAFYHRILRLGAHQWFDVLSLHGTWNDPETFQDIEEKLDLPHKPAVMSEWHAILSGNSQSSPLLSEEELALRMLKDMLHQLKHDVERVIFFQMSNGMEKEVLGFAAEQRWFMHSSGMFRTNPQVEPRLTAVVMQNFLRSTGNHAVYQREGRLAGNLPAVLLETAGEQMIVLLPDARVPVGTLEEKRRAGEWKLTDWEGRSPGPDEDLVPGRAYFLTGKNLASLVQGEESILVSPRKKIVSGGKVVEAEGVRGELFAPIGERPSAVGWIEQGWNPVPLRSDLPADREHSARFATAANAAFLDIVVEVKDSVHSPETSDTDWWNGDSLQIGIDCEGAGLPGGHAEFVVVRDGEGNSRVRKLAAADAAGDIPTRWTPANNVPDYVESHVFREGNLTTYQVRIPWTELYPLTVEGASPLRLSLVVNNNNGQGRAEYLEWSSGIGGEKDPAAYGKITFPSEQ